MSTRGNRYRFEKEICFLDLIKMSQTSLQTIQAIERALLNGISADKNERDESYRFLVKECEPNPAFQLALLHIIENRPDYNA